MILFLCNVKGPVNSQFLKIERYLLEFFGKQLTYFFMDGKVHLFNISQEEHYHKRRHNYSGDRGTTGDHLERSE